MKSVLLTSSRTRVLSVVYVHVYVKRYDLIQSENEDTVFWCLNVIRANNRASTESHVPLCGTKAVLQFADLPL